MRIIESVEIKYFRSFGEKNVRIKELKDLNIFSGSNDVGKSNILKALNLFFNNETNTGEQFDIVRDLSILQKKRSDEKLESKKASRTKDDPYAQQRDLFVKVKIFFNRDIPYDKSTSPERFWVERTWDRNGFRSQTSNILNAYKQKNKKEPRASQLGALQGQLTQFLNSIYFEYIPAVKDRLFLKNLFRKLQKSLFERDVTFKKTSDDINSRISGTTLDLFSEFKEKTGIDAKFTVPESLIDFFTTIFVSTGGGVSLYSRGDGIQARFIPAILNEISKGKKNVIWGFEEPENSYEYRNAELLAKDFLKVYSNKKQIFLTSHTKEFLSLIKGNEERVSLHRVYKTLEKGSLVETYKKGKGFDKNKIQLNFWEGVQDANINDQNRTILNKIFQDIGFLENDQYLIENLQHQLEMQRNLLESSGLEINKRDEINNHLNKRIERILLGKSELESEIEEYNKPILYVEDTYDQIYKIAYLKLKDYNIDKDNFEVIFKENAPFTIRRGQGAGKLAGRLRTPNNDGYENKKIVGLFDFDKEGRENIHNLKKETFWDNEYYGSIDQGFWRKRTDHNCFYALLIPIPQRLENFASLEWENFISYVEIENLLPSSILVSKRCIDRKSSPAGEYLKIKDNKKSKIWQYLFELNKDDFKDLLPLFDTITKLFNQ